MLRRNFAAHLGLLALGASVICAGVGRLPSAQAQIRIDLQPGAPAKAAAKDHHGDPLPQGATHRLGTVRFRCPATSVAYSPDGKLLAVGCSDNQIRLLDAATGQEVRRLSGHQVRTYTAPQDPKNPTGFLVDSMGAGNVTTLAFSPDGKTLASGGWDDMIRLWDVGTGKEVRKFVAHPGMVARVVFSPDGKSLASRGGVDGVLRLWDPETGAEKWKVEGVSRVNPWRFYREAALAFAPDGKTIVASTRKGLVFHDVATGKETAQWPGYRDCMYAAYSPDGKLLATGGLDDAEKESYSLRIWSTATGKEVGRCDLPKTAKGGTEPPTCFAFSRDGDKLVAAIAEMDTYLFDVTTGKQIHRLGHYWSHRVAYGPDGKSVLSVGGPTLRSWDAATGKERFLDFTGHRTSVSALAVSKDGKLTATGGENVRLWDTATGKLVREFPGSAVTASFSPDGSILAVGGGRSIRLLEVGTGKEIHKITGERLLRSVVFSPDGKLLASGDEQAVVKLWDPRTGKQVREVADLKSIAESLSLAFSPDGKTLACAGGWNQFGAPGLNLNIQGRVTVTGKQGYFVLLWDVNTGQEVRRFEGLKDNIKSVAFSPDGKTLAGSSRDGRLLLWDAATGKEKLHILAHPAAQAGGATAAASVGAAFAAVPALAFSPDGKTLASAGGDRTLRLWDTTTAKQLGVFTAPDGDFTALVFTPDGKTLITAGTDTTALIWNIKPEAEKKEEK
jgi:WD40 repeat protein